MNIARIETIRCGRSLISCCFVFICENGMTGPGETYYLPGAVEAVAHELLAGFVLGQSIFDHESHWNSVFSRINNCGYAGAEMRALSALDIALWDLIGQTAGQPIYNLIGGRCRDRIRLTLVVGECGQPLSFPERRSPTSPSLPAAR